MNALELELPNGIHSAGHLFDGKIREIVAYMYLTDDFHVQWDSVVNGKREKIQERLNWDQLTDQYLLSKRVSVLADLEKLENGAK